MASDATGAAATAGVFRTRAHAAAPGSAHRAPEIEAGEDLHVCPRCGSGFVQPREWAPVDMRRWRVELACPECDWHGSGLFSQQAVDRYDEVLDEGAAILTRDLHELAEANMRAAIESFSSALAADQILPEDF